MYKINSILKMLALTLAFSFLVSCSDDDDENIIIPGGNTTPEADVEATELVVTGQLFTVNMLDPETFKDWNAGACSMSAYVGTSISEYKVGEGTINADGSYSITLQKTMKGSLMHRLSVLFKDLDYSPATLSKSLAPINFYADINGDLIPISIDAIDESEGTRDIDYYYSFFSADGHFKGTSYSFSGNDVIAVYDINCKKGWNLISNNNNTNDIKSEESMISSAKAYVWGN